MINQIGISGFQSLKNVMLELGQITVIVGETDCGKTAFYRAFRGFCTNTGGKGFVTDDGVTRDAVVGIKISDNDLDVRLGWRKGNSNYYKIDDEKYDKVGQACPEDVQAILKMGEIDLGGGVKFFPNFHGQFDVPFLQAESGSYVAKVLGEITNINRLLLAVKMAKSRQLDNKKILKIREEDLKLNIEVKLEKYKELDSQIEKLGEFNIDCNVLEMSKRKMEAMDAFLSQLNRLEKNLLLFREAEKICQETASKFIGLEELGLKIIELADLQCKLMQLIEFEDQLRNLKLNVDVLSREEEKCFLMVQRYVGLEGLEKGILALEDKRTEYLQTLELETQLEFSRLYVEKLSDEIENANAAVVTAEGRIKEFKEEHEVCPLCGKVFGGLKHEH